MILYHYTALEYLDSIRATGLNKGDVPLTPNTGENAVWLTTDDNPAGHGLSEGSVLTAKDRHSYSQAFGVMPPEGTSFADKRAVRIKVIIPSSDRALKRWLPWAKKRLDPDWLETLTVTGGGKAKAESWYLYRGVIEPHRFVEIIMNGQSEAA